MFGITSGKKGGGFWPPTFLRMQR